MCRARRDRCVVPGACQEAGSSTSVYRMSRAPLGLYRKRAFCFHSAGLQAGKGQSASEKAAVWAPAPLAARHLLRDLGRGTPSLY